MGWVRRLWLTLSLKRKTALVLMQAESFQSGVCTFSLCMYGFFPGTQTYYYNSNSKELVDLHCHFRVNVTMWWFVFKLPCNGLANYARWTPHRSVQVILWNKGTTKWTLSFIIFFQQHRGDYFKIGVICSFFQVHVSRCPVEFWTSCRRLIVFY